MARFPTKKLTGNGDRHHSTPFSSKGASAALSPSFNHAFTQVPNLVACLAHRATNSRKPGIPRLHEGPVWPKLTSCDVEGTLLTVFQADFVEKVLPELSIDYLGTTVFPDLRDP